MKPWEEFKAGKVKWDPVSKKIVDVSPEQIPEEQDPLQVADFGFLGKAVIPRHKKEPLPWERVGSVVEEMHPDMKVTDRLLLKNLGTDKTEDQVKYLREKYPDMEITTMPFLKGGADARLEMDGDSPRVYMRKNGATDYHVLDPKGFKDWGYDIMDAGTDIASGAVSGLASTGAALAAGIPSGGAASIPAAMAAGGGVSAAMEYLKQKLGQQTGVRDEVDPNAIAMSGISGVAAPALFGTGVGKVAAEKALGSKATKEVLEKFLSRNTGAVGQGWNLAKKALPSIGSFTSGVSKKAVEIVGKRPEILKDISSLAGDQEEAGFIYANKIAQDFIKQKNDALKVVGPEFNEFIRQSGKPVNIAPIKDKLKSLITDIESKPRITNSEERHLANLKELFAEALTDQSLVNGKRVATEIPDVVNGDLALNLKQALSDHGEVFQNMFDNQGKEMPERFAGIAKNLYHETNKAIDNVIKEAPSLRDRYAKILKAEEFIDRNISDRTGKVGQKAFNNLSGIFSSGKSAIKHEAKEIDKNLGTNLVENAENLAAHRAVSGAGWTGMSSHGGTSSTKTLLKLAGAFKASAGLHLPAIPTMALMGAAEVGTSPKAFINYMKGMNLAEKTFKAAGGKQLFSPMVTQPTIKQQIKDMQIFKE